MKVKCMSTIAQRQEERKCKYTLVGFLYVKYYHLRIDGDRLNMYTINKTEL